MEGVLDRPPPRRTIAYGPSPYNVGHLRVPSGPGPHPILIVLHGGYWRARYDLSYMEPACAALTEAGYATWNVEYRRLGNPGGGWPGTLLDVAWAADMFFGRLINRAASYSLDIARIAALGHSAGGHLALWLAARHRLPIEAPFYSPHPLSIRGVVSLAGIGSLSLAAEWGLSDGATASFLGGTPEEAPDRYFQASPDRLLPLGVPQILLHGTEDEDVPFAMSERYAAAASAAGDQVELIPLPGGHFEAVNPTSEQWSQVLMAVRHLLPR